MSTVITLSKTTKKLIEQLKTLKSVKLPEVWEAKVPDNVKLTEELVNWLTEKHKVDKKTNFLLASLHAGFLKDIDKSLFISQQKQKKQRATNWSAKLKFMLLAAAGTVFFACEGFDGITAILVVFSLPTAVIFTVGIVFAILSVLVFYDLDLVEISKNLEIKVKNVPKILDLYLKEVKAIKAIRKKLGNAYLEHTDSNALEDDLALVKLLIDRFSALDDARRELNQLQDKLILKVAKYAMAGLAGIIFFSGGFYAGQTVALAIASLFMITVATTFWPVIAVSVGVGASAFSIYWFVGRPSMENLVARLAGLDKEKMDLFCGAEAISKQKLALLQLQKGITLTSKKIEKISATENELYELKGQQPKFTTSSIILQPIIIYVDRTGLTTLPKSRSFPNLGSFDTSYRFYSLPNENTLTADESQLNHPQENSLITRGFMG